MDEEEKGLYTVAEAAAAWGITPQAVYQRLTNLSKEGFVVVKGKKRYISREGIEAYKGEESQHFKNLKETSKPYQPYKEKLKGLPTPYKPLKKRLLPYRPLLKRRKRI